jgi:hypothetical protein
MESKRQLDLMPGMDKVQVYLKIKMKKVRQCIPPDLFYRGFEH